MQEMTIVMIVVVAVFLTAVIVYLSLRRQKNAVKEEMKRLTVCLMEMENKIGRDSDISGPSADGGGAETQGQESQPRSVIGTNEKSLSAMDDAELFAHISKVIKDEELFRWSDFNRSAVMEHFSLSAARVGSAFMKGGGMGLPEFVRNCRLDYACRLIVEHPEMSFVEVGESSGYQRTTTFYHDFKARFDMTPAEYRKMRTGETENH